MVYEIAQCYSRLFHFDNNPIVTTDYILFLIKKVQQTVNFINLI